MGGVMRIFAVIGGISKDSINKRLFELIKPLAPKDFEFDTFDISKLPFFSQDFENSFPANVVEFRDKIVASDAVLFITPEYNRSIPGVLKNAIDLASRPIGHNIWKNKPAAVLGASLGLSGTLCSQIHLRSIISFLGMYVMYQPEVYLNFAVNITEKGEMSDNSRIFYENFLISFKEWILKHNN
jgi:chromate reductase